MASRAHGNTIARTGSRTAARRAVGSRAHRTRRVGTVQRAREINVVLLAPDLSTEHQKPAPRAGSTSWWIRVWRSALTRSLSMRVLSTRRTNSLTRLAAVPCGGFSFCALFKLIWDDVGTREEHANIQSHPV